MTRRAGATRAYRPSAARFRETEQNEPVSMRKPFVYLASRSPRREALLAQIGVDCEVFVGAAEGRDEGVDETPLADELPIDYVRRVARAKADAGWRALRQRGLPVHPLLAADTAVAVDTAIMGKGESPAQATAMLCTLSGRTHDVYTAVALAGDESIELALSATRVTMRALSQDEIARYVASDEPIGKAGSYAIQGRAAVFIERIEGSYSGVMGLPLYETARLLANAGLKLP
jgi:septum formation protein